MAHTFRFDPVRLPPQAEELRREVRAFLQDEIRAGTFDPARRGESGFSRDKMIAPSAMDSNPAPNINARAGSANGPRGGRTVERDDII